MHENLLRPCAGLTLSDDAGMTEVGIGVARNCRIDASVCWVVYRGPLSWVVCPEVPNDVLEV